MQGTQETQAQRLGEEDFPGEGNGNRTPVFLPGESHGQRNLAGYSPWDRKETLGGCLPAGKTKLSLETWNFQPHLPILLSKKG